jgi:NAD(P)H-hydrate epimerase
MARELYDADQFPVLASGTIIIDAIFGSGLSRPTEGLAADVIRRINDSGCEVISIDLPSGLFSEDNTGNTGGEIVRAKHTLTFQFPKLSFMFAENEQFTGSWTVLPIGLHPAAIASQPAPYTYTLADDVLPLLRTRKKFAHKGSFGHGLLVAGSEGKTGACILGAAAALRSGIGLITCHTPSGGMASIHAALPEAMVIPDRSEKCISVALAATGFSAVAVGPGLGKAPETARALFGLLTVCDKPMVIDADALNILSMNKDWLDLLRPGTILTPHPGEFDRLAGKRDNGYSGLMKQVEFSRKYGCIVILKGAFTSISTPDGRVRFNSTGNPGMATAGSGDVLTGILLSLLSQGLDPSDAALTGVYLHGLAGDIAAEESGYESIIASDIINCLGKAFNRLRQTTI